MYGKKLTKGVLIDMLNNKTVYLNKNSCYSFTSVDWVSDWIVKNLSLTNKTIEIGSKDYVKLKNLAKFINSKSKFIGRIDNQIIKSKKLYNSKSSGVYNYIKENR